VKAFSRVLLQTLQTLQTSYSASLTGRLLFDGMAAKEEEVGHSRDEMIRREGGYFLHRPACLR
jgi:hypothetical protein